MLTIHIPSFADSTPRPPTPKRTPKLAILPSPVFETPKNNQGRSDESTGWTPRFAEEFSVFNSTPGNFKSLLQSPFPDFSLGTPFSAPSRQKDHLLTEPIVESAVHANELSPEPNQTQPPVESSKALQSPPTSECTPAFSDSASVELPSGPGERSAKKSRRNTAGQETQRQVATPPPTARKGERKIAPKLDTSAMQNDQDFDPQSHFMATAPQGVGNFMTTQGNMFGYPLSAPAAAPGFDPQRSFWDADSSLAGMEIDFGANGAGMFQSSASQQDGGSVDWIRTNPLLHAQGGLMSHANGQVSHGDCQAALVSQPPVSMLVTSADAHAMFATASYPTPIDDPFGISGNPGGAVNPGLLLSRPPSASMDPAPSFNQQPVRAPSSSLLPAADDDRQISPSRGSSSSATSASTCGQKASGKGELRRSASAKDSPRKPDRTMSSSPVKGVVRLDLSRSLSENRGKKTTATARPSLPPLAPAPRPQSQLMSSAGMGVNRPIMPHPPQRPHVARSLPPKTSSSNSSSSGHHHHRLPSLTSIPEASPGPQMRTQAKFTIDENGRAHVETIVVVNEPPPSTHKRHSIYALPRRPRPEWDSSDDESSSSTDDEPIIIPSRNASFALPDPRKPSAIRSFQSSQKSMSERSVSSASFSSCASFSNSSSRPGSQRRGGTANDSDEETVVNDTTPTRSNGNALSELQKLRESRQRQQQLVSASKQNQFSSASYLGQLLASSPAKLSETNLPTPTTGSRRQRIRCVCNRSDAGRDELLVTW